MSGRLIDGPFVAVFPSLVRALGSIEAAVVLQVLHFHATDGMVRITARQVADETGIALRTVQRKIAWLREEGLVITDGRPTGFDPTLTFQINHDHPTLSLRDRQSVATSRQNGGHSSIENEVRRTTSSSPSATAHESFATWWGVYPRKVGKAAAEKAYANAVKSGATPDRLLAALHEQAGELAKDLGYCPHPSTWLNQGRWMDETAPTPAAKKGISYEQMRHPR